MRGKPRPARPAAVLVPGTGSWTAAMDVPATWTAGGGGGAAVTIGKGVAVREGEGVGAGVAVGCAVGASVEEGVALGDWVGLAAGPLGVGVGDACVTVTVPAMSGAWTSHSNRNVPAAANARSHVVPVCPVGSPERGPSSNTTLWKPDSHTKRTVSPAATETVDGSKRLADVSRTVVVADRESAAVNANAADAASRTSHRPAC